MVIYRKMWLTASPVSPPIAARLKRADHRQPALPQDAQHQIRPLRDAVLLVEASAVAHTTMKLMASDHRSA